MLRNERSHTWCKCIPCCGNERSHTWSKCITCCRNERSHTLSKCTNVTKMIYPTHGANIQMLCKWNITHMGQMYKCYGNEISHKWSKCIICCGLFISLCNLVNQLLLATRTCFRGLHILYQHAYLLVSCRCRGQWLQRQTADTEVSTMAWQS